MTSLSLRHLQHVYRLHWASLPISLIAFITLFTAPISTDFYTLIPAYGCTLIYNVTYLSLIHTRMRREEIQQQGEPPYSILSRNPSLIFAWLLVAFWVAGTAFTMMTVVGHIMYEDKDDLGSTVPHAISCLAEVGILLANAIMVHKARRALQAQKYATIAHA